MEEPLSKSEAPIPQPPPIPTPGPWGFWSTVGWTIVLMLVSVSIQFAGTIVFTVVAGATGNSSILDAENLEHNGLLLGMVTLLYAPATVGLCIYCAWLRKGITVRDYLKLRWPERKVITRYVIYLLLMVLISDGLTALLGRSIVPDFMLEAYQSAGFFPLLFLAVVVAAPFSEEFLFRGFLFTGLLHSRAGPYGAILLTSLVWAAIHLQYDFYGVATIFFSGLLLGYARWKTESLWLCILLHSLMNLVATVELLVLVWMTGS